METCLPEDLPEGRFDVVVANILAGPLVTLSAQLLERLQPGGRLALSGILQEQQERVLGCLCSGPGRA
ncbi:MAG: 50S ribosomal protein L11 methyltransferase [Thiolinea sp.]